MSFFLYLIKHQFCHTFWGFVETDCLCKSLCKTSFSICIALTTAETERSESFSHTFFRADESGLSGRLNGPAKRRNGSSHTDMEHYNSIHLKHPLQLLKQSYVNSWGISWVIQLFWRNPKTLLKKKKKKHHKAVHSPSLPPRMRRGNQKKVKALR